MIQRCNLNCRYCGATVEPEIMHVNLGYSTSDLLKFLDKDEINPVIAFYSGEPTINFQKITEIMDHIPHAIFNLQTNGTLLHRIPETYFERFNSILLSIDGDEEITNFYRGENVYKKIIDGGQHWRNNGFNEDLIARMTVSLETDIFTQVTHLLEISNLEFDHVHWQLHVMWDTDFENKQISVSQWIDQSYNPGISRLVKYWANKICSTGDIFDTHPIDLVDKITLGELCSNCGVRNV
ncbi:MAG: 7-carboxy-7-deazaguanine synthase [Candidatus Heimdallarchaeota archaeon LC_2]|nr:MAG: 7-carboxy-7-deazaguanine synthase [Candidatus Heimdallarchaeota archaeon LC_2]